MRAASRRGVIGLRYAHMKDYWDEMCGALYNQAEVTGEPKIHGVPEYG